MNSEMKVLLFVKTENWEKKDTKFAIFLHRYYKNIKKTFIEESALNMKINLN